MKASFLKKEGSVRAESANVLFKQMPTWWVTLFGYLLAALFCRYNHWFFSIWFPPYLYEVFKNLRGLPTTWADLGLYWAERGFAAIAVLSALYHQFWQIGTRYVLTEQEVRIEAWFPVRRVTSIPLGAIRRYGYQQNWLAWLLNFGTVEIDTASSSPVILPNCPKPKLFLQNLKPGVEEALQKGSSIEKD
jgi:hypothetical protein